jgi:hypothetical protein
MRCNTNDFIAKQILMWRKEETREEGEIDSHANKLGTRAYAAVSVGISECED